MRDGRPSLAAGIGEFVQRLDSTALSEEHSDALKLATLDCIAAIFSGVNEPVSKAARSDSLSGEVTGQTTIIGTNIRAPLLRTALANGTSAHACDYDEVSWSVWGHATAPILPATLAAAERLGLSGADFLVALAAGLEVSMQIGRTIVPTHYERGWHSTSTLGVIGAAAGSAKAMGLNSAQIAHAIGIAASRASGLRENFGSMTKALHVGFANRDGCEATLLAKAGVTASPLAIEGPYGFLKVMACDVDVAELIQRFGSPFDILVSGLTYKLYPSCGDTHAAIDAMLELRKEHNLNSDGVRSIYCGITPLAASNLTFHQPETPLQAKFSTEFCVAVALAQGNVGLQQFTPEGLKDPIVRHLVENTRVEVHAGYDNNESLRYSPAIVSIELNDGRKLVKEVRIARGNPTNPLTTSEMKEKFLHCAALAVPENASQAVDIILALERLTDVRDLLALLACRTGVSHEERKTA